MFKTINKFLILFERFIACQEQLLECQQQQLKISSKQVKIAEKQSQISDKLQTIAAAFSEKSFELANCADCGKPAGEEVSRTHEIWCHKHG